MNEAQVPGAERALDERFQAQLALARSTVEVPWPVRRDRLVRLKTLLHTEADRMAAAISADFGNRSRHETRLLELFPGMEGIRHALAHGRNWMRAKPRQTGRWFLPGSSAILPQPLGVIGIVAPWNYPVMLTMGPLTGAFAAGNRAMVKVSEYTPAFGALLSELATRYFAPEELYVANGDAALGAAFCALPFDHLLFTGSTTIGRLVMRSASANLTPVTLELGGKSPAIIGPNANFALAVERIMAGKLVNAGQTCIAPDYVLLPRGQTDAFITAARAYVKGAYPALDEPGGSTPDYTTIIAARHMARLEELVREAKDGGANVVPLSGQDNDTARRLFVPVLLTDVAPGARVMQEEIFGPVLPLVSYETFDEALAYVNARPRPLALYLFERDRSTVKTALAATVSGGVTVNETLLHIAQEDLPFGGVGPSGMGAYHGYTGFLTFSHQKPVFRQSRVNAMNLFAPPYGKRIDRMLRMLIG